LNPAFTGKFNGTWRLASNFKNQWGGILDNADSYKTQSVSFDLPLLKKSIPENDVLGVGLSGLSDQSGGGALKLNYGSVSLSYHKALDEDGYNTIGAGFQGTYSSIGLDVSKLTFEDELQQTGFQQGTSGEYLGANPLTGRNINYFDVNAGILYSGSSNGENNYYLGFSLYHINRPSLSFKNKDWFLTTRSTVHGGGSFPISDILDLNVSFIQQFQNKATETILGGALAILANGDPENPTNLHIGTWMRLNDAIIPYLGLEVGGLRIGASYDATNSALKTASTNVSSYEFSLIYTKRPVEIKGIPCPRF
jgi:type IX secretion system PorP/SprF family membrane protein